MCMEQRHGVMGDVIMVSGAKPPNFGDDRQLSTQGRTKHLFSKVKTVMHCI